MGEESVHHQGVSSKIVVGIDGHRYKPLSLQEAKSLCCDIPFYVDDGDGGATLEFTLSRITPEDYRRKGNGRLHTWYESPTSDFYYVRVDGDDKSEYTPEESNI